jgi:DNA-binding transcriptional ArsR family regulator
MMEEFMEDVVRFRACELFSALSHPTRLRIVEILCTEELSVGDVAIRTGIGQSGASQHLAILARAGILVSATHGTSKHYKTRGPRIKAILKLIEEFCHTHYLFGVPSGDPAELG